MFRIEQIGRMSLGRPKPPTKGGSAPDEEEETPTLVVCLILKCKEDPLQIITNTVDFRNTVLVIISN